MKMRWLVPFLLISLVKRLRGDDIYADCVISGHLDKKLCQRLDAAEFEGPIIFKGPSIQEASKDFEGIYHNKPAVVLYPASTNDIRKLIRIAATSPNLTVAARGNGHSIGGQAMALSGIVVNMTSLTGIITIYESGEDIPYVEALAGDFWVDVLRGASEAVGLAPRSWTDYIDLSIGGTQSNAGVSGETFRFSPQISNVLQLEIVTGYYEVNIKALFAIFTHPSYSHSDSKNRRVAGRFSESTSHPAILRINSSRRNIYIEQWHILVHTNIDSN